LLSLAPFKSQRYTVHDLLSKRCGIAAAGIRLISSFPVAQKSEMSFKVGILLLDGQLGEKVRFHIPHDGIFNNRVQVTRTPPPLRPFSGCSGDPFLVVALKTKKREEKWKYATE
jgi:hypothetical protein